MAAAQPTRALALWPWVGLLLALGVTLGGWLLVRRSEQARIRAAFDAEVESRVDQISRRLAAEEQILLGAAEFASQKGRVSRSDWRDYVMALELPRRYPGIQGLGFARWLRQKDQVSHERQMQEEGFSGYHLQPAGDFPPDPEGFSAVVFLEPLDGLNRRAIGLDIWSEGARRQALIRARDFGVVAATGRVHLVQDGEQESQAGVILYAPVYRHGVSLASVADRRRALVGWANVPLRMDDHFQGILGRLPAGLMVQVFEGEHLSETPLFPSGVAHQESGQGSHSPRLVQEHTIDVSGQTWRVLVHADERFTGALGEGSHWTFLACGVAVSLLVFLVLWSMARAERRAERLAAERLDQLISSEARYAAVIDSLSEGLLVYGEDGRIRACNPAAVAILGMTERELIGSSAAEPGWKTVDETGTPLPPENHPVALALKTRAPQIRATLGLTSPAGHFRWLHCTVTPILGTAEARNFSVAVTILDVTDTRLAERARREAESALGEAQKAESLGLMAGGLAHDFNNLFQALLGNLELAQARADAVGRQHLDRAKAALDKASGLSRRLMDFSGGSFTHLQPMAINPLILEVAASRRPAEESAFRFELAAHLPEVLGDSRQIRQILEILIENAVEAIGGTGGAVILTSERITDLSLEERARGQWAGDVPQGPLVRISISDTGGGAGPEVMKRLFDPFFSTKAIGRGLGLPSALGLIRGNRAGVQVVDRPGDGMDFRIYLSTERRAVQRTTAPAGPVACGRGAVLVVDDETELRQVLAEALRECHGCTVLEAADGIEAIEVFQAHAESIGLVLMDSVMPRMKGPEAFDEIQRIRPGVAGILMSGFSEETGQDLAHKHGFSAFLKKPFPLKDLSEVMAKARVCGSAEDPSGTYS
jgi:PAS domain S-box-containing protein